MQPGGDEGLGLRRAHAERTTRVAGNTRPPGGGGPVCLSATDPDGRVQGRGCPGR